VRVNSHSPCEYAGLFKAFSYYQENDKRIKEKKGKQKKKEVIDKTGKNI
jgi:hypothetical protein